MSDKFDKTREALKKYFEHEDTFEDAVEYSLDMSNVEASPFMNEWFDEQCRLRIEAGHQFCRVTPNSMDKAPLVSVDFMVRMTEFSR